MAHLLAIALACNQTRVFNMLFSQSSRRCGGRRDVHPPHADPRGAGDKELGYQPVASGSTASRWRRSRVHPAFANIREGAGTLLDNMLIFANSDTNYARVHSVDGVPVFTGRAGGRLKTGLHVVGGGDPITRVGLTAMQAMGLKQANWGTARCGPPRRSTRSWLEVPGIGHRARFRAALVAMTCAGPAFAADAAPASRRWRARPPSRCPGRARHPPVAAEPEAAAQRRESVFTDERGFSIYDQRRGLRARRVEVLRRLRQGLAAVPGAPRIPSRSAASRSTSARTAYGSGCIAASRSIPSRGTNTRAAPSATVSPDRWRLAFGVLALAAGHRAGADRRILVNDKGLTLYIRRGQAGREVRLRWDVPRVDADRGAGAGAVSFGDWTVLVRADGTRQWAFKGQPLYLRRSGDFAPGEMTAHGVDGWKVLVLEPAPTLPPWATIQPSDAGELVANPQGLTVYSHGTNARGQRRNQVDVKCPDGTCIDAQWLPLLAEADAKPVGNWTVVDQPDGKKQWAYKGQRLYTNGSITSRATSRASASAATAPGRRSCAMASRCRASRSAASPRRVVAFLTLSVRSEATGAAGWRSRGAGARGALGRGREEHPCARKGPSMAPTPRPRALHAPAPLFVVVRRGSLRCHLGEAEEQQVDGRAWGVRSLW